MKSMILALTVAMIPALSSAAGKPAKPTEKQIARAKHLPATVVLRINKKNPKDVAVVHLKEHVPAGDKTKVAEMKFEKMALNAEKVGVAYSVNDELDVLVKSTSAWYFGFNNYYNRGIYGGAYYRPFSYAAYGWNQSYARYYPTYRYYGYNYNYAPYYGYSDGVYDYAYCNWSDYGYGGYGYGYNDGCGNNCYY